MSAAEKGEGGGLDETPVERTSRYLEERGVAFELVEHDRALTAAAEAHAAGIDADDAAKGVLLHTGAGYMLAVIPASARLDLDKVRGASGEAELRLASESEMAVVFPESELGAVPPFGPDAPAPEVVDRRLLEHERILCNAGDHRHSLLVAPGDLVSLASASVADLCQG